MLALATTAAVLIVDILYGVLVAIGLSMLDCCGGSRDLTTACSGTCRAWPACTTSTTTPTPGQVPGLVVYRYDSPLFFANAQDFKTGHCAALDEADADVEWMLLNFEANVHIDLTSVDALEELHNELDGAASRWRWRGSSTRCTPSWNRPACHRRIGEDHVFETLPTAVQSPSCSTTSRSTASRRPASCRPSRHKADHRLTCRRARGAARLAGP